MAALSNDYYQPITNTCGVIVIYSSGAITTAIGWTVTTASCSNYPREEPDVEAFQVVLERSATGRMRVRRPPQPALEDPWVPPQVAPRPALVAWPTLVRRHRSQRE